MLNPLNHTRTQAAVQRYKVEPYVVAGDVYAEPPHVGRGGWTWYTGSAGWMYRAGLECILGFRLRGTRVMVDPCIPQAWPGFTIAFRYHSARSEIVVENMGLPMGIDRLLINTSTEPPEVVRRPWLELPGFLETPGQSATLAPDGRNVYVRGGEERPVTYLRVIPGWVDRMKQAVDEANR